MIVFLSTVLRLEKERKKKRKKKEEKKGEKNQRKLHFIDKKKRKRRGVGWGGVEGVNEGKRTK